MNDAMDYLDDLARCARRDTAPRVNVAGRVLARLSEPQRRIDVQMAVLAAASFAMAAITISVSAWSRIAPPDPIESMIVVTSLLGL
jgi:hypothetical protein